MRQAFQSKLSRNFAITFFGFGNDVLAEQLGAQVLFVSRPHLLAYDEYSMPGVAPIQIQLRDDVHDHARAAVVTQLAAQQAAPSSFGVNLEALANGRVVERWLLDGCRITGCEFSPLGAVGDFPDYSTIHLEIMPRRVSVSGASLDEMHVLLDIPVEEVPSTAQSIRNNYALTDDQLVENEKLWQEENPPNRFKF